MTNTNNNSESLLDQAIRVRGELNAVPNASLRGRDLPELQELLYQLDDAGHGTSASLAAKLGTTTTLLEGIFGDTKAVSSATARMIANQLERLLVDDKRDADYYVHGVDHFPTRRQRTRKELPRPTLVIEAIEWKAITFSPSVQKKISELVILVQDVITHVSATNLPSDQQVLSDIERAQLIAVLETALNVLKSPLIEKGLLKKAGAMVKRAAAKAAERQTEIAFSTAGGAFVSAIVELLKHL
jgi:hypothetical protein